MRFMVILKSDANSESGVMPTEQELTDMGNYNEELVKAGVMLAGEGLQPSSKGARVKFDHGKTTVLDGPFSETKELIAGFWLIQAKSKEEAVKRVPISAESDTEIEIRQVFEAEDFSDAYTPEVREQEDRMRAQAEANQQ